MSALLALLLLLNRRAILSSVLNQTGHADHALDSVLKVANGQVNARDTIVSGLSEEQASLAVVVHGEGLDELQDGE